MVLGVSDVTVQELSRREAARGLGSRVRRGRVVSQAI